MNLDSLLPNLGEWLRGTGPEADVVVSTRLRLARNLAGFPFTGRATPAQKSEVETKVREAVGRAELAHPAKYLSVAGLPALDKQFLVERQLISRELASVLDGPRGVAFDDRETVSIMVNEEDHLRLQVMRSGLALEEAWAEIDSVDDALEARIGYAFHDQFGYLTACPTNVGTGMRAASCSTCRPWASPSKSRRCSRPCRRSTWWSAGCTARAAGPAATCTRSATR